MNVNEQRRFGRAKLHGDRVLFSSGKTNEKKKKQEETRRLRGGGKRTRNKTRWAAGGTRPRKRTKSQKKEGTGHTACGHTPTRKPPPSAPDGDRFYIDAATGRRTTPAACFPSSPSASARDGGGAAGGGTAAATNGVSGMLTRRTTAGILRAVRDRGGLGRMPA